jgi:hypothetical protein
MVHSDRDEAKQKRTFEMHGDYPIRNPNLGWWIFFIALVALCPPGLTYGQPWDSLPGQVR